MKQYTTPEQTAKLIELGFEKPMWRVARKFDDQSPRIAITSFGKLITSSYENVFAYAIGELIEMLTTIKYIRIAIDSRSDGRTTLIVKQYQKNRWDVLYGNVGPELCDSLFNAVVKLKGEGVI